MVRVSLFYIHDFSIFEGIFFSFFFRFSLFVPKNRFSAWYKHARSKHVLSRHQRQRRRLKQQRKRKTILILEIMMIYIFDVLIENLCRNIKIFIFCV